ncbi:MAG TPA: D-tyrosyl-tRNA(Tyr) deacylase [Candidatus Fimenecus excrementavium]|nr:D-tyrosyl-tRNA(Tyr) deacylase [Candidatus Fimenecus excrementavium]
MKAVIQRVSRAEVRVDGEVVGKIGEGYLILVGVMNGDTVNEAQLLARKTANLRIFTDENDKMNRSILDIDGEVLAVSQFTLCADVHKGNRPSFIESAPPQEANALYEAFCSALSENGVRKVEKGVFGAHMEVSLLNNGPVTILYDTDTWKGKV